MALLFIDFQWGKDKAGYRLVEAEPANPEPVIHPISKVAFEPTLLSRVAMPQRVVPNGGERIAFQPLKKVDRLYKAFASIRTPKDALHFIRQYGPLTETGPRGEEVKRVLNWAATFRDWLNAGRSRRRQLAERFGEGGIANLQASLIASRSGEVRLRLVPKSLLGA